MSDSKVRDGQVVSMEYTLRVDGEVVDSSEGQEPLEFLCGAGNIVPGLEKGMLGMEAGQSRDVVVAPDDGYGAFDPEAIAELPRGEFPGDIPLEPGVELQFRDPAGAAMFARVISVTTDTVRMDFNHPLAGKELHFAVRVVSLRDATGEEREHGHVHDGGHHH